MGTLLLKLNCRYYLLYMCIGGSIDRDTNWHAICVLYDDFGLCLFVCFWGVFLVSPNYPATHWILCGFPCLSRIAVCVSGSVIIRTKLFLSPSARVYKLYTYQNNNFQSFLLKPTARMTKLTIHVLNYFRSIQFNCQFF